MSPMLEWDKTGERYYETGIDRGVLYLPDDTGSYLEAEAWNGLTTVTESPSGAEATKQYADNIVYLNLVSVEEFGGTIEAFTYPPLFEQCNGVKQPSPGLAVGQQGRRTFGFAYRTILGNDTQGNDLGYKLHLVYGALVAPSEKAFSTVNDSPEAVAFSWEFSTTPVPVQKAGYKPTSLITIDSTKVAPAALALLEEMLYGDDDSTAYLPLPDDVFDLFDDPTTTVDMGTLANQPTYNAGTHVVTLPNVTGVVWTFNGEEVSAGAQPALTTGQKAVINAKAAEDYYLDGDKRWVYNY